MEKPGNKHLQTLAHFWHHKAEDIKMITTCLLASVLLLTEAPHLTPTPHLNDSYEATSSCACVQSSSHDGGEHFINFTASLSGSLPFAALNFVAPAQEPTILPGPNGIPQFEYCNCSPNAGWLNIPFNSVTLSSGGTVTAISDTGGLTISSSGTTTIPVQSPGGGPAFITVPPNRCVVLTVSPPTVVGGSGPGGAIQVGDSVTYVWPSPMTLGFPGFADIGYETKSCTAEDDDEDDDEDND